MSFGICCAGNSFRKQRTPTWIFSIRSFIQCVLVEPEAAEFSQAIRTLICNVFAKAVTFLCAALAHEVNVFASMLLDFAVVPRASFEYVFANGALVSVGR